jgi:hypothetical protein
MARYEEALDDVQVYLGSRPELIEVQIPVSAQAA